MVKSLPKPAQRYFNFAIKPGTPLYTVAEIRMKGKFSLGTKAKPNYLSMQATQVLAAPQGFIWKMNGGTGLMKISGSDSTSWTRFWLAGVIPVARSGGSKNHARSAFGRYVAEALFWTPAALLPGDNVFWSEVDNNTARVSVWHRGFEQSVDITVDATGQPLKVVFPRWSNANAEKTYQLQPFGGVLSDFGEVNGFRLAMHVEAGNFFDTDDYYPFFIADITDISFPVKRQ